MSAVDQRETPRPGAEQGMVVVDDISARLHVRPATETSHRYDRAVIAAAMAEVLTRHLEPDIAVEADGTVWCRLVALAEHGFTPDETTGQIPRRAAAVWEEVIVEHIDLAAVELAGQRTHVHVSAASALPGQMVTITVNETVCEDVDPERVDSTAEGRWERAYGIGAAAAIRTAAAIAAGGGAGRAGQVRAVRAPVTWPVERSPWVAATPLVAT